MFEIDRIPSIVWDALKQKDICTDDVLLTARADRTCDHTVADVFKKADEQMYANKKQLKEKPI